ncbi:MAG: glycoside hydrolase family 127 protein, partial [Calditrichaeota bacterium]
GNAKYLDVLERTLYNGLLAGVSLSGDTYFYPNCLAFDGHTPFNQGSTSRKAWFGCSCCPSNISRFIPSLPGYFYAQRHDTLYVNLYAASTCSLKIKEKSLQLIQETFYPWEGDVRIRLKMSSTLDIVIKLRIPGWAYNQPVPGDLYRYIKNSETAITCSVNQQPVELLTTRGNVTIARRWKDGDIISLHLPMEIKQVQANEQVMEDRGKISLERGPIVYCLEAIDNQNSVSNLWFNADHPLMSEYKADLLSGLTIIKGEAFKNRITPQEIVAVPYYAWNHRGSGEMAVWLAVHDGLEE